MKMLATCLIVTLAAVTCFADESKYAQRVTSVNGIIHSVSSDYYSMPSVAIQWHANGRPAHFQETTARSHHGDTVRIRLAWYPSGQKQEEWLPGPDGTTLCRQWAEDGQLLEDGVRAASGYAWSGSFRKWAREGLIVPLTYTNGNVLACQNSRGWTWSREWKTALPDLHFGGTMTFHAAFVEYCAPTSVPSVRFAGERICHRPPVPETGQHDPETFRYRSDFFVIPLAELADEDLLYLRKNYNFKELQDFLRTRESADPKNGEPPAR